MVEHCGAVEAGTYAGTRAGWGTNEVNECANSVEAETALATRVGLVLLEDFC